MSARGSTVNKCNPLLLHYAVFFLAHRSADDISMSVCISGDLAAYLHYLLLVYYTSAGV